MVTCPSALTVTVPSCTKNEPLLPKFDRHTLIKVGVDLTPGPSGLSVRLVLLLPLLLGLLISVLLLLLLLKLLWKENVTSSPTVL